MRIKLSVLFIVIALIALVCSILFMAPIFVAGLFCGFTIIWAPAIWLTGAIYSRGIWRPFFIGGMFTGVLPHIVAVYYGLMVVLTSTSDFFEEGLNLGIESKELLAARLMLACVWSIPGFFAFTGGAISMLTYRIVRGRDSKAEQPVDAHNQPMDLQRDSGQD